jgi:hypothetical protein
MLKNIIYLVIASGILLACQEQGTQTANTETEKTPTTESAISPEQQAILDCLSEPEQICQIGLWFAMLQDPIADLPLEDLGPKEIADSVITEEGYSVVRRTVYLEGGEIMIEGEYQAEEVATDESLNASLVNRIYVRTREYHTEDDIRVGDPLQKLIDTYGLEQLEAGAIADYQTLVVPKPGDGHLVYHFSDPGNEISAAAGEELTVDKIPASLAIREIVVL